MFAQDGGKCKPHAAIRARVWQSAAATSGLMLLLCIAAAAPLGASPAPTDDARGKYFAKTSYTPKPLPAFKDTKGLLPAPIYDEKPLWVETYWKAWELAFRHFYEPPTASGFVSQFIDAAFNPNIFLWDTCFMSMFCKYAHPLVPGVGSLDNFYARQHEDGEIGCRLQAHPPRSQIRGAPRPAAQPEVDPGRSQSPDSGLGGARQLPLDGRP
jgi:hypothetical protein